MQPSIIRPRLMVFLILIHLLTGCSDTNNKETINAAVDNQSDFPVEVQISCTSDWSCESLTFIVEPRSIGTGSVYSHGCGVPTCDNTEGPEIKAQSKVAASGDTPTRTIACKSGKFRADFLFDNDQCRP
jgi:hypothetical protein